MDNHTTVHQVQVFYVVQQTGSRAYFLTLTSDRVKRKHLVQGGLPWKLEKSAYQPKFVQR